MPRDIKELLLWFTMLNLKKRYVVLKPFLVVEKDDVLLWREGATKPAWYVVDDIKGHNYGEEEIASLVRDGFIKAEKAPACSCSAK